jgi:hypothetical protein
MALSGSFYTNVSAHWRLQLEWSATQNISANTSTVTARMYWIARDGYGAVYSSATKDGSIWLDGTWYDFSGAGLAKLSANQKKQIHSVTKTITHNADGTKDFGLDGFFDAEVSLNSYVGRIEMPDGKRWDLNTIPRKSSIATSRNFTAGSDYSISVNRASSSFTHKAYIDVKNSSGSWVNIKNIDFGHTTSSNFSTAEKTEIFKALNGRESMETRINLHTYSGGDSLGYNTYTGTVKSPMGSGLANSDRDMYVDESYTFQLDREDSEFTHTLVIQTNGDAINVKTITGVGSSVTWTPTQAERDILYGAMTTETSKDGNVEIHTFYNGVLVRYVRNYDINFYVRNSEPTFNADTITYVDTNTNTKAITGDGTKIIQKLSTVQVTLPVASRAIAKNKASIVRYIATLGNQEKTANYSTTADVTFDFTGIDAGVDQTAVIKAIDSRGYQVQLTKTITMIPYSSPVINGTAKRKNGFENSTTFGAKGTMKSILIGGVEKNGIASVKFRYKKPSEATTVTTWANWRTMSFTRTGTTYIGTNVAIDLDNGSTFNVEFQVTDKFTTTTYALTLAQGKPILFLDAIKKTVGIGKFSTDYMLDVGGNVNVDGNINVKGVYSKFYGIDMGNSTIKNVLTVLTSAIRVTGTAELQGDVSVGGTLNLAGSRYASSGGGLDANNADIIGVNGLWFGSDGADVSDNMGEGLLFPRTGTPANSTNNAEWDTFYIRDNTLYLNELPVYYQRTEVLWEGAVYMTGGQKVTPKRSLADCPNGYILVWSDYDSGVGSNNFDFNYTIIHKGHISQWDGTGTHHVVAGGTQGVNQLYTKYVYANNTWLEGNQANAEGDIRDVCLRKVIAW